MGKLLKYMPVLRVRQEEVKVLKSFDFGNRIYPCLEIIKELDGFLAIGVAMSILLMSFGAVGLLLKEELRNEK